MQVAHKPNSGLRTTDFKQTTIWSRKWNPVPCGTERDVSACRGERIHLAVTGWLARWDQQEVAPSLFDNFCCGTLCQTWRTCSTFVMNAATCKEVHYTTLQLNHTSALQPASLYNNDMAWLFSLQVVNDTATHTEDASAYKTSCYIVFFNVALRPDSVSWPPLTGLHGHNQTYHTR